MRGPSCVLLLGLWACRPDPAADHLKRELAFFDGFVELAPEAAEVRRVLRQRHLAITREIDEPSFWAVAAAEPGGPQSAVRVVTRRGVVLGFDGDLDAPLLPFAVALDEGMAGTVGDLTLVGVTQRPRGLDVACLRLFRVLSDGRVAEVGLDVSRFGERACVASVTTSLGRFFATVAWPGLAAVHVPTLSVELRVGQVLLGQEERAARVLELADDGAWLAHARARLAAERLSGDTEFSARHALGVARAALGSADGMSADAQRAAYLSALLPTRAGSPEAAVVADTLAHIARGWLDSRAGDAPAVEDQTIEAESDGHLLDTAASDAIAN